MTIVENIDNDWTGGRLGILEIFAVPCDLRAPLSPIPRPSSYAPSLYVHPTPQNSAVFPSLCFSSPPPFPQNPTPKRPSFLLYC